ncbi:hypothetical protein HDU76_003486 [Blyttiomyces sp. JEL0837]|nr:hypothetical protein HDU76_003486 [Blyttiomyces sp. JEL0837]
MSNNTRNIASTTTSTAIHNDTINNGNNNISINIDRTNSVKSLGGGSKGGGGGGGGISIGRSRSRKSAATSSTTTISTLETSTTGRGQQGGGGVVPTTPTSPTSPTSPSSSSPSTPTRTPIASAMTNMMMNMTKSHSSSPHHQNHRSSRPNSSNGNHNHPHSTLTASLYPNGPTTGNMGLTRTMSPSPTPSPQSHSPVPMSSSTSSWRERANSLSGSKGNGNNGGYPTSSYQSMERSGISAGMAGYINNSNNSNNNNTNNNGNSSRTRSRSGWNNSLGRSSRGYNSSQYDTEYRSGGGGGGGYPNTNNTSNSYNGWPVYTAPDMDRETSRSIQESMKRGSWDEWGSGNSNGVSRAGSPSIGISSSMSVSASMSVSVNGNGNNNGNSGSGNVSAAIPVPSVSSPVPMDLPWGQSSWGKTNPMPWPASPSSRSSPAPMLPTTYEEGSSSNHGMDKGERDGRTSASSALSSSFQHHPSGVPVPFPGSPHRVRTPSLSSSFHQGGWGGGLDPRRTSNVGIPAGSWGANAGGGDGHPLPPGSPSLSTSWASGHGGFGGRNYGYGGNGNNNEWDNSNNTVTVGSHRLSSSWARDPSVASGWGAYSNQSSVAGGGPGAYGFQGDSTGLVVSLSNQNGLGANGWDGVEAIRMVQQQQVMNGEESEEKPPLEYVCGKRWKVTESIGAGSFGEVFAAVEEETGVGFQKFIIMVMERLGPSLKDLQRKCPSRKIPLRTVVYIVPQLIKRLQSVHERGLVFRDAKPDQFCVGRHGDDITDRPTIFLVDFGLSTSYLDQDGRHMQLIKAPKNAPKTGTARYASLNVHKGRSHSRRDDMESLAYIIIELSLGSLPWSSVRAMTSAHGWKKIGIEKDDLIVAELTRGLPNEFGEFLVYAREMRFNDEPDYSGWVRRFVELFGRMEEDAESDRLKKGGGIGEARDVGFFWCDDGDGNGGYSMAG